MALDFPSSPTVGQQYLNWTWNGVAWVVTAAQPVPFYNNSGRNLVDNALLNVQQRGPGPFTANSAYTADRWQLQFSLDSDSVSLVALTDAQRAAIGDESAIYGLQNTFAGNSGAGAFSLIQQKIERLYRLSGKTTTISFFAQASAPLSLGVSVDQIFGTGGSPSPQVSGTGQAVPITTSFARYQLTVNLPSDAGKVFGTNGDSFTLVNFWYSSGANLASRAGIGVQSGTVTLWGVQVEVGSQATPLEKLDPETDLARCRRFFMNIIFNIGGYTAGGTNAEQGITLPVHMRASPSVVLENLGYAGVAGSVGVATLNPDWYQFLIAATGDGQFGASGNMLLSADL